MGHLAVGFVRKLLEGPWKYLFWLGTWVGMGVEPAFRETMQIMGGRELPEDSLSGSVGQLEKTPFQITTRTQWMTLTVKFKNVPQAFRRKSFVKKVRWQTAWIYLVVTFVPMRILDCWLPSWFSTVSFARGFLSKMEILQMALLLQAWEHHKACGSGLWKFALGVYSWPGSALEDPSDSGQQPYLL